MVEKHLRDRLTSPGHGQALFLHAVCWGIPVPPPVPRQPYITALWPSHRPIKALIS